MSKLGIGAAKRPLGLTLALLLVVLSIPLWLGPRVSGPSVEVRDADGLMGTRLLLEHWDTSVELLEFGDRAVPPSEIAAAGRPTDEVDARSDSLDANLESVAADRALLLAFPAGRSLLPLVDEIDQRIRSGGGALVTYSGAPLAFEEGDFFSTLGVQLTRHRERKSILPWSWWRRQRGGQSFELLDASNSADEAGIPLSIVADELSTLPRVGAQCRPASEVVTAQLPPSRSSRPDQGTDATVDQAQRADDNGGDQSGSRRRQAAVMRCALEDGILWLAPTTAFANDRIGNAGNIELLRRIRDDLGDRWTVVEGGAALLSASEAETADSARATLNTMALQLSLLYLGAVLALAWGFGPRWRSPELPPDGHRGFLLGVGALHHRLGRLPSAARMLDQRWLEYDPLARRRSLEPVPPTEELTSDRLVEWAQTRSRTGVESHDKKQG